MAQVKVTHRLYLQETIHEIESTGGEIIKITSTERKVGGITQKWKITYYPKIEEVIDATKTTK